MDRTPPEDVMAGSLRKPSPAGTADASTSARDLSILSNAAANQDPVAVAPSPHLRGTGSRQVALPSLRHILNDHSESELPGFDNYNSFHVLPPPNASAQASHSSQYQQPAPLSVDTPPAAADGPSPSTSRSPSSAAPPKSTRARLKRPAPSQETSEDHFPRLPASALADESEDHDELDNEDSPELEADGTRSRDLKTSRRAAQNRAAQRAFRERKEMRIKVLEDKAKELDNIHSKQAELEKRETRLQEREAEVLRRERSLPTMSPRLSAQASQAPHSTSTEDRTQLDGHHQDGGGDTEAHTAMVLSERLEAAQAELLKQKAIIEDLRKELISR